MANRLVYIDVHDQKDVPDRFHYIGQSWLYMYRTEIYSEDEYVDYLGRHPDHNLLMTNNGVVQVSVTEAERHLAFIKNENRASYRQNAEEKRKQPERAKARNEAKRKAAQASAYGQAPAKKGTVSSVARTSESRRPPEPAHHALEETGEWQKWYGKWHQKVIRYGRVEWEEG